MVTVVMAASKPCLDMRELAELQKMIEDMKNGGIRLNPSGSPPVENVTNWDIQSTVFLALQVIGSVGELAGLYELYSE